MIAHINSYVLYIPYRSMCQSKQRRNVCNELVNKESADYISFCCFVYTQQMCTIDSHHMRAIYSLLSSNSDIIENSATFALLLIIQHLNSISREKRKSI